MRARAYAQDGLTGLLEAYGRSPEQLQSLSVTATIVPLDSIGTLNDDQPVATRARQPQRHHEHRHRRGPARDVRDAVGGRDAGRLSGAREGDRRLGDRRGPDARAGGRRRIQARLAAATAGARPARVRRDVLDGDFVRAARAALRASTTPAAVRATKGFDLFAQGDYGSAAAELGEALKLDQTSAATAFVLGWAYEEAGRPPRGDRGVARGRDDRSQDAAGAPRAGGRLHADVRTGAGGTSGARGPDRHARIAGAPGQARANPGEIVDHDDLLTLGLALMQTPSAKTAQVSAPAQVTTIDTGKLKGEPTQLAWSPDGDEAVPADVGPGFRRHDEEPPFLRHVRRGRQAVAGRRAARLGRRGTWAWKSGQFAPGSTTYGVDLKEEQRTAIATAAPMGGSLARGAPDSGRHRHDRRTMWRCGRNSSRSSASSR